MAVYLGLDGFRNGWVAFYLDDENNASVEFICEIKQIRQREFSIAAIDIPIGLPRCGNRNCDEAAREKLGNNRNRVFTGARRPLLDHLNNYDDANALGKELGAGVSKQLFAILRKIKEVDSFVREFGTNKIRECHPELVFSRLAGNQEIPSKKTEEGKILRRDLLGFVKGLDRLIGARIGTGAKEDDVLDAFACAVAARECGKGNSFVVPATAVPRDDCGLAMQIWY